MTDPFWMIMTMQALGDGYIVWDKAATIEFVKPGRGTVVAEFRLDDTVLEQIRAATAGGDKHLHWFETPVRDAGGDTVALVRKQVYVRRKKPRDATARAGSILRLRQLLPRARQRQLPHGLVIGHATRGERVCTYLVNLGGR